MGMKKDVPILATRLLERLLAANMGQSELARRVGMKPQGVQSITAGKVVRPKLLREIAWTLGTSEAYLLGETDDPSPDLSRIPDGGEFEPDPEFDPDAGNAASSAEPYKPSLPNARPEIDVKPGAGLGTVGQTFGVESKGIVTGHRVVAEWVIPPDYMRHELGARPSMIMVMQVIGDSMEPTLKHNDRVLVDISQNVFGPDAVYVIDDGDGEPRVKRLTKNIMSDPPSVSIKSDNPLAEQRVQVLLGAFRIVGRVVGRVTGM